MSVLLVVVLVVGVGAPVGAEDVGAGDGDRVWGRVAGGDVSLGAGFVLPYGLWSDGVTLWVADPVVGAVLAYGLAGGERREGRDVDGSGVGLWMPMGVGGDGEVLWVSDLASERVYGFDVVSGELLGGRTVDPGFSPGDVWSDGETLWVVDAGGGEVAAFDAATGDARPLRSVGAGVGSGTRGLWSDGVTLWVADGPAARIDAYDLASGEARPQSGFDGLADAGNSEPAGIWSDGDTMWVLDHLRLKAFAYRMAPNTAQAPTDQPEQVQQQHESEGQQGEDQQADVQQGQEQQDQADEQQQDDQADVQQGQSGQADEQHQHESDRQQQDDQAEGDAQQEGNADAQHEAEVQQQDAEVQVVVRAEDEIGEVVLWSGAAGELTVSWEAPVLVPFEYRVSWAREDLEFLSFRFANEAHRGNEWPGGDSTSVTLTGLEEGAVYKVQLRARFRDARGKVSASPWTAETTATVHAAASLLAHQQAEQHDEQQGADDNETETTEGVETTVSAAARPTVADAGLNSISVRWTAPEHPETPITGYDLRYRAVGASEWSDGPQDVAASPAEITGLQADTAYEVAVRAQGDGAESEWSEPGRGSTAFWVATLTVGSLDQSTNGYWGFQNKLNRFGDLTPRTHTRDGVSYEFLILAWYRGYRVDADGRTHTEALDFYGYDHVMPADWVLRIEDRQFRFRDATRGFLQTNTPQQTRQYKVYWRHPELSLELGSRIEVSLSQEPAEPRAIQD
ncbi:fibronectin type III domain-containing protein [Candidatus Poriferisodalis sp.]|uniref:fibronectin type III domain-containing protein n=1 Tax=Candidatus Poriferisodalis sp. TaxID=3101277 RepID=UPI003B0130CD